MTEQNMLYINQNEEAKEAARIFQYKPEHILLNFLKSQNKKKLIWIII